MGSRERCRTLRWYRRDGWGGERTRRSPAGRRCRPLERRRAGLGIARPPATARRQAPPRATAQRCAPPRPRRLGRERTPSDRGRVPLRHVRLGALRHLRTQSDPINGQGLYRDHDYCGHAVYRGNITSVNRRKGEGQHASNPGCGRDRQVHWSRWGVYWGENEIGQGLYLGHLWHLL